MKYAVIMAGGTGKRLWPLSRQKRPKQVLRLLDGHTLLERCFERLTPIFDIRNIIVLTNAAYVDVVRQDLPSLPSGNVIAEPTVRDTAGAIGLAASVLARTDPQAAMAVVTADQLIEPAEVLQGALRDALTFVDSNPDALVTFGIKPTFPSTQLGYVKCGEPRAVARCRNPIHSVEAFKEKPDLATAQGYVADGRYFWNSGMFVWKAQTILANLTRFVPQTSEPLRRIAAAWDTPDQAEVLADQFPQLPKISIDYAVMERATDVHAIRLDCRWLDMGSFAALADIVESDDSGNVVVAGTSELLDCRNSVLVTEDKGHLIAAIGLDNVVVAHTPDATLVCRADQTERLKELLASIESHHRSEFL
ncbi:MAG: sugar phosphate nucleotidyltransferase [Sedimentisphaerales bacterium]|jgi:mannose-1-phosphate guanylyltransferase|nr:sugar phosphate nucleotidyltransferase [Sedimentisphaerales bacterium]HNY79218.1 sugar phosphate nucleotidyltransferase [Sedimentisphaerales bacterium]HOC61506.1 sugar phosphate nucleotidyltransferase [Sedimentisphaerales bacterium]HOH65230.1 sugar phosphate nucleotidyltransferase [Sedimentisphaerales bacterium]HPY50194.1 sugar phosphate nucleotidyltransferase [Sedimentisphaerales bacterium]